MMSGFKVTTKVLFENKEKELLILKNTVTDSLTWDLPGGTLEIDEQIDAGIVREIEEELGLNIQFSDLTLFNVYVVNREKKQSLLVIVYTSDITVEEFRLSDEHCEYMYATKEKIATLKEDSVIFRILEDYYEKTK